MLNNLLLGTTETVIIVVVAAVFAGAIIAGFLFNSKKRRSVDETVLESREDVSENAQKVRVLIALAEGKADTVARLEELYDTLRYLTPSAEDEVAVIDEKIKRALDDIKIELTKTRGKEGDGKTQSYIDEIKVCVAERAVHTER